MAGLVGGIAGASAAPAAPPRVHETRGPGTFTEVLGEAAPARPETAPAAPPTQARGPAAPAAPPAAGVRRLLVHLVEGERRLDRVIEAALGGKSFTVPELIGIQATVLRYAQEVEVVSRVVDRATSAVKTTMQTQV